jgi:spermidine dehydrogenase
MNSRDRGLGMDKAISRRDFLGGVGTAASVSLLPACARTGEPEPESVSTYFPPDETGMRGSHPGSFENAHATVAGQQWSPKRIDEHYDLVVVGAGISGLSAAYIYRRDVDANARILILDNHDDFGGHAKRNEFTIDGRTLIGLGGTMLMEDPTNYPSVAAEVIQELGIKADSYDNYYHSDLFKSLQVTDGTFFDKETFGADFLAVGRNQSVDAIADSPLSDSTIAELTRLFADEDDYLAGMTQAERLAVLQSLSWREYLQKHAGMGEEALTYLQKWPEGVWAIGSDAFPAWMAWRESYPGFVGMEVDEDDELGGEEHGGVLHFPDGNATVARLLVRKLVPGIAPGDSMEDVVTASFNYSKLDSEENATRIRLSSTVVKLQHQDGKLDADVDISYVNDDTAVTVTASKVVWAGYHAMLPYVCPDVPEEQMAAQGTSVRAPLVYTNVLIRDWTSFANLGVWQVFCAGSFFQRVRVNRPVSIGDYHYPQSPDEPTIVHLQHIPLEPGLSAPEQFRAGRRQLLATPFETFERNIREQLGSMLGAGGFDPARDIAGITVNRWPHGYAYSSDPESGDVAWYPDEWRHDSQPWIDSSQSIGNIVIAGTDASSNAMTESAIEEAHRAVHSFGLHAAQA